MTHDGWHRPVKLSRFPREADRVGAHLWQSIVSLAQGAAQNGKASSSAPILLSISNLACFFFSEDALTVFGGVGRSWITSVSRFNGRYHFPINVRDQIRYGVR